MAISQSVLLSKARLYTHALNDSIQKLAYPTKAKSAFLCHSHKDEVLVKGLIGWFQEKGIQLYVDWMDHEMPETPNAETAKKIQAAIVNNPVFLFLATANSKASRWCPWEIGYADSSHRAIYIIPTDDGYTIFGNEYLGLYPRIDDGTKGLGVFQPGTSQGYILSESIL